MEKHAPSLLDEFAPSMSPMAAQAVLVRQWNQGQVRIIGASPCMAKKSELLDPELVAFQPKVNLFGKIEVVVIAKKRICGLKYLKS